MNAIVLDQTGLRLTGAAAALRYSSQVLVGRATSDSDGRFQFRGLSPGSYLLEVIRDKFAVHREAVRIEAGMSVAVTVQLQVLQPAESLTVTAEAGTVVEAGNTPQRVNVIEGERLRQGPNNVLSDVLAGNIGVAVQTTAPAMGGVFVRGLTSRGVAVYRDGVRYTTATQRGGVSTFFNLQETSNLQSLEILRGPNSAQYGSDSMGGVVHLLSREPPAGEDGAVHGEFSPFYSSGTHAFGGNFLLAGGGKKWGWTTNLASRRVNTLRTGRGLDSHAAVTRFLGLPSSILGERLPDTAFTQYGGMVRLLWRPSGSRQITAHYERNHQDGAKRYDQLLGGDGNLIADLRNLMLDFGYIRFQQFRAGPFDLFSVTVSYNSQREERVNQGGQGDPAASIQNQFERTSAWGSNFAAQKDFHGHQLVTGGEGYWEKARAPAFTTRPFTGVVSLSRNRIPDGARYAHYGFFLQDAWQALSGGRLRVSGALRWAGASYVSRAANSPLVQGVRLFPDDSATVQSLTGRVGAVGRITGFLQFHAQLSRGFRAPNITDLGTLGLQGNGAFETSIIETLPLGGMIGSRADELAVSTNRHVAFLRPEFSNNYDGGFTLRSGRLKAEITGFLIDLRNTIESRTLILPPASTGLNLGSETIVRQLPTGAVFVEASPSPVQVKSNAEAVRLLGFEQMAEARLHTAWSLRENFTWLFARDRQTGLPPDLEGGIPAATLNMALRWSPSVSFWVEAYGTAAGRQSRLSTLALADRRTGASRSRSTIASFFRNGARARGLIGPGPDGVQLTSDDVLLATGENLPGVQERVLAGSESAPMFTAVPGYLYFGLRGGYRFGDTWELFADGANLGDGNYRGLGWGVDGPGRSIAVRLRFLF